MTIVLIIYLIVTIIFGALAYLGAYHSGGVQKTMSEYHDYEFSQTAADWLYFIDILTWPLTLIYKIIRLVFRRSK